MPNTNSAGWTGVVTPGTLGNVSVAMTIGGTREQLNQYQPTNSFFAFQTEQVTLELKNSSNNLIDTGTGSYYASGWHDLGNTSGGTITLEMLPGTYSFAMVYQGERNQITQDIGTNPIVMFQTVPVTIKLEDHSGNPLNGGPASYYASGWHDLGNTSGGQLSLEMLPGTYSFAMVYQGERNQTSQNIGNDPTVVFRTIPVTVELTSSNNDQLTGTASYYASGWHDLGSTNGGPITVEMLPGTYSFAMVYQGERNQMNQNIGENATVSFHTVPVTVKLETSIGPGIDGGGVSYYASGWHSVGSTTSGQFTLEMLPGTYTFGMSINGTSEHKTASVSGPASTVTFQTGMVMSAGTATSYYASGWKPFTQKIELLPGTYTFAFSNGNHVSYTVTAGQETNIP